MLADNFTVAYQPGVIKPTTSQGICGNAADEKENLGIEEEVLEHDILVCKQKELADAVTLPVLQGYTAEDEIL